MSIEHGRGSVVKGPDLFADHDYRPYVRLSDDTHPFDEEETLYIAIPLTDEEFATGGLPRVSYANPWTIVSIRHADIDGEEGRLVETTTEAIATAAAGYLGIH